MTTFTLTVLPDGHAILSTEGELGPDEARAVSDQWDKWKESPQGVAILAECRVQHAKSVELELAV